MYTNAFIVYALCDARTHQIRYVGSSEVGLARPSDIRGYKNNPELTAWLRDLAVCGSEHVILVLAKAADVASLRAAERYWIQLGKHFGWPLLNKQGFTLDIDAVEAAVPPQKREKWKLRHWRNDPEVRARLAEASASRKRGRPKNRP